MSSSIDPSYCCILQKRDESYTLSKSQVLLVATAIIGLSFIITGLFLLLGGIGTIPSQTGGIGLVVGGGGILIATVFCYFKQN